MTDDSHQQPPIPGLIRELEISRELRIRRSQYVFVTIPKACISEYEDAGWTIAKKNKKSCRMRKPKAHDVLLEDRTWVMLSKLGWTWMNKDRNFRLRHAKNEKDKGKQIDVFATDDETVLIAECKSAEERRTTPTSFAKDIQEISAIKKGVDGTLRKAFGTKRKMAWLFFTHNHRVGEADQERFKEKNVFHIPEDELSYYEKLVEHLGPVAKYQLFGRLFEDQDIPELDTRIPALRAKTAGHVMYSFLIEPELLLKIGHVLHRTSATSSDLSKYQRLVNKSRVREIQRFIEKENGFFPNSIILNIRAKSKMQFDLAGGGEHASETTLGVLHLPRKYHSAMIIDGQHRLFGYGQTKERLNHMIPVVAFQNLRGEDQANMFITINAKQKSVPKNLLMTLRAEFDWDSRVPSEAKHAAEVKLVEQLNDQPNSVLYKRVVLSEESKSEERCLTLRYLQNEGLKRTELLATVRQGQLIKGHCWAGNWEKTVKKGYRLLNACFETLQGFVEEQWKKGSGPGGFAVTNASITALVLVIDEVLAHLVKTKGLNLKTLTVEQVHKGLAAYLNSIGQFLASLDPAKISEMRSYGGGGAKNRIAREYQNAINHDNTDFNPEGFSQWKKESTRLFNDKVKPLCERLNTRLSGYVRKKMKEAYGEKHWQEKLPPEVVKKAFDRRVSEDYKEPLENYVDLADYEKIIEKNSKEVFDIDVFTAPEQKGGSNKKKLEWFGSLLRVRNKTSHPERAAVTEEEYETIRELDAWLFPRLDKNT